MAERFRKNGNPTNFTASIEMFGKKNEVFERALKLRNLESPRSLFWTSDTATEQMIDEFIRWKGGGNNQREELFNKEEMAA